MGERRGMKALELWCRRITKDYPGVRITNMTTSWRDGLGFCAIIHHFRPDLIDFDSLRPEDVYKNNALAFETAETSLSVPALLDPQDMVDYEVPDRLSILTYVSQFYQAFVGQQGVPRPEKCSEPQQSPEPPSPTVEKHVATSVRQREPCSVCQLPVFLAERQLIERRLVHRTCFKCARCGSQLSTANYYITEDGQFCCEVCPDEEIGGRVDKTAAVLAHERAVLAGTAEDPLSEDADAVLELRSSEDAERRTSVLSGVRVGAESSSSDSESDSDDSESESATETLDARRTVVAINGEGKGGDGEGGVDGRGGVGEVNGVTSGERLVKDEVKTSDDISTTVTANRTDENLSETSVVEETATETETKPEEKTGTETEAERERENEMADSPTPPAPVPRSRSERSSPSTPGKEDGANHRLSLVQQRLQQFKAAERPQPAPRRSGRYSGVAGDSGSGEQTPPEREGKAGKSGEIEKKEEESGVESSNPFGDEEEEEKEKDDLNPFGSDDDGNDKTVADSKNTESPEAGDVKSSNSVVYPKLPEEEPSKAPSVKSSEELDVSNSETPTNIPGVAVTEPTPPKPVPPKEYNPFDDEDDDDEQAEQQAEPSEPSATVVKPEPATEKAEEEYPDDLNPFGDDDEEPANPEPSTGPVAEGSKPAPTAASVEGSKPAKPPSLNPFGDSDEEDEEEVTPVSSAQSTPAKLASGSREINPFEKPPRPPPPTLDRRKLAGSKGGLTPPRPPEPPGLVREQRAGSLTSLSSSGKKKRPAPRPPGVSPSHSQGVSPAHSPSTLRKRHAPRPPPPPVAAPPAPTDSPTPTPTPADPSPAGAGPKSPSPERSKAEKEQVNYNKQSSSLTNKSIQGQFKRRKGPAPLRPKPIKRQVRTLPPKETQTELHDINIKQLELERQGVELEKTIRQLTEQDDKQQKELDSTAPYGLDIEDMILQLFELVNEKNALFRRQAELMYMRRQHRLEEEHAELEYEIRCLMMKADSLKSDMERQREQRLIERLVSVVEQRNEIVTMLEMERIREIQEDATIDLHMAERVGSVEPAPEKKKKKKKKKDKKEKESSGKKKGQDDDKDIDEKEQATEKKKSKKIKLKKLFS